MDHGKGMVNENQNRDTELRLMNTLRFVLSKNSHIYQKQIFLVTDPSLIYKTQSIVRFHAVLTDLLRFDCASSEDRKTVVKMKTHSERFWASFLFFVQ